MSKNNRVWAADLCKRAIDAYETGNTRQVSAAVAKAIPALFQPVSTGPASAGANKALELVLFTSENERLGRKRPVRLWAEMICSRPGAFSYSPPRFFGKRGEFECALSLRELLIVLHAELREPAPFGWVVVIRDRFIAACAPTLIGCVRELNDLWYPQRHTVADVERGTKEYYSAECSRALVADPDQNGSAPDVGGVYCTRGEYFAHQEAKQACDEVLAGLRPSAKEAA